MSIKELVAGGIITVIIGGSAYTVSQTDVINNFADDTGMSQEQAESYVNDLNDEDMVPYNELGDTFIVDGEEVLGAANQIDCYNYEYDWQTPSLSCETGKMQLEMIGNDGISLGHLYKKIGSDSASEYDISNTIVHIDKLNSDFDFEIVRALLNPAEVDESKKTNSFNKATLQAALEGE